jgi:hypothetical protein
MAHSWMAVIQYPSSRQARKFSHKAFFLSSYRLRTYRYDAFSFFQEHHTGVILRQVPTGSLDHLAVDSDQAKVGTTRESWCRGPRGLEWYQPPGPVGTIPTGAVAVGIACSVATWCPLIHPYFQFEFKYNRLNWKVVIFIVRAPKNPKKIKLHPPSPYKYPHGLRSSHSHTNTFPLSWHTHTMSSSSSSDMEDQIINTFSGVMDQAMSILAAEEDGSLSTWRLKHCVNHDHEAAHFSLWHDYFNDDCVYPRHTSAGGTICGGLFF